STRCERRDLALEQPHLAAQLLVLGGQTIAVRGQVSVILPPIETDLLRLVDRAHDQSNSNREQFDFGERDLDVARHDQTLVENSVEYVDEPAGATIRELEISSHPKGRQLAESIGCLRTRQQSVKTFSHRPKYQRRLNFTFVTGARARPSSTAARTFAAAAS